MRLRYYYYPNYYKASVHDGDHVTVVTQLTYDRYSRFQQLADIWKGTRMQHIDFV